jgi:hypothetical protein
MTVGKATRKNSGKKAGFSFRISKADVTENTLNSVQ